MALSPCSIFVSCSSIRSMKILLLTAIACTILGLTLLSHNNHQKNNQSNNNPTYLEIEYDVSKDYLVKTPNCSIPYMAPDDPSVIKYIAKVSPLKCSSIPPLFTSQDDMLILSKKVLAAGYGLEEDNINCCYHEIIRVQLSEKDRDCDSKYRYGDKCVYIQDSITRVPVEFIRITCITGREIFYRDFHAFVHRKKKVEERVKHATKTEKLSILIMGVDAVSRVNMMRNMPDTRSFLLRNMDAIELLGYNKVGDNTFPNMVPILSGQAEDELKSSCWNLRKQTFDRCPFLWKHLASRGYRTLYAEDAPRLNTFNFGKIGFAIQPTDYYLRPFAVAMDQESGHVKELNSNLCYGPHVALQVMLNYAEKAARLFAHESYFSFVWTVSMTHDYLNYAQRADPHFRSWLEGLTTNGILDRTVLIFVSDHGLRWGGIQQTYQGKMESRLPFLYFVFPKEFQYMYPSAYTNLKRNIHHLTTPFDLHETLLDISNLSRVTPEAIKDRTKMLLEYPMLPRGISLFLPIPESRSCNQAGISEHFCACHESTNMSSNDPRVQSAALFVVSNLNQKLVPYKHHCAKLTLLQVREARQYTASNDAVRENAYNVTIYVTLEVSPSGGIFDATVLYEQCQSVQMSITGHVSRINLYGKQSRCVNDYSVKEYCYCT